MRDPREGVTAQGMIRTGATRGAIAPVWDRPLRAAAEAVVGAGGASLHVRIGRDGDRCRADLGVDLLPVGLPADVARRISAGLSRDVADLCRAVSIAPASRADVHADTDEGHGLRVFLRHYCVHLAGDDPAADLPAYAADATDGAAVRRVLEGPVAAVATAFEAEIGLWRG